MNNQSAISTIIMALCLLSCSKANHSTTEDKIYEIAQRSWKSDKLTQYTGDINYSATEVPLQYYLLKSGEYTTKDIDSLAEISAKERIIEFEYEHVNQKDLLQEDFTQRDYESSVKYMAFAVQNDFKVVTSSNDTIACIGAHFERNFKVAPYKKLLLYFEGIAPEDNIQLLYNDQLFGNGLLKFNFQSTPLKL